MEGMFPLDWGGFEDESVEKTMRRTPAVIRKITDTRRHEKRSRRKRKAKTSTKTREEDLHMAENGKLEDGEAQVLLYTYYIETT